MQEHEPKAGDSSHSSTSASHRDRVLSFHPGPAQAAYAPLSTRFSVISKSRPLHTAAFPMSLAGCPPIA